MAEEKRRYKRIDGKFVARFHVRPHQPDSEKKWDIVTLRNLSGGGILFNYDGRLPEERTIDLKVNVPGIAEPLICEARIIRVDPQVDYGITPIAAVFTRISSRDRERLEELARGMDNNKEEDGGAVRGDDPADDTRHA
jgi:hypothetical protein